MRPRREGAAGFTLIEVIVVIAVISILAAMAVPYAVKILDLSREEATKKQMEEIHRAIMGDPKGPTAGYLGDRGALPALPGNLTMLNAQGTQAGRTTGTLGVKYGWYGPYVKIGYSDNAYLFDGWGTLLAYNSPGAGQIRSAGPDRAIGTADDLAYPSSAVVPGGRLLVNLYVWRTDNTSQYVLNPKNASFPPMQMDVRMYYSANGVEAFKSYTGTPPPSDPPYVFSSAQPLPAVPLSTHAGFHAVTATCTLPPNPQVSGQAVVYIPENNQQAILNLYLR